ncbi:sugar ABC transporter substrate-binding protein [Nitrospira sp. KM1]|uniref:polysaccharide biosynthesis/export family protein n=1 Tax=Nitrospira sp. KM1 TaxID=1936990 RepID=UPI0013A77241|nr:polysaccharide biosynthesis/export family protein [Nitrospira sp. KM1]BCA54147.1 sugar ABC transporter substrate-binding protein [Nitrospira sp. KM1]
MNGIIGMRYRTILSALGFMVISAGLLGCFAEETQYRGMSAPPTEFLIGPEDVLVVTVWRNQELSKEVIVRPDGKISLPLIGDVTAAGLTAQALSKQVAEGLAEFMSTPTVSVQVKEINSYHVFVVGEVARPGKFVLKSFASVLQGISYAGGFTTFASRNNVHVLRMVKNGQGEAKQVMIPVPYQDIVQGKNLDANIILKAGDVIVVP